MRRFRIEHKFLVLCERGSPDDIKLIKMYLGNDPARVYEARDPRKLINAGKNNTIYS